MLGMDILGGKLGGQPAEITVIDDEMKPDGAVAKVRGILVIDKTLAALMRLADRHVILEKGRTVWTGNTAALRAAPDLLDRYLHL